MLTIKNTVVKNMCRITLLMVAVILVFSTAAQVVGARQTNRDTAQHVFDQVEQILIENSNELKRVQEEYAAKCLNDARMVAYILEFEPELQNSVEEMKKIAAGLFLRRADRLFQAPADGPFPGAGPGRDPQYGGGQAGAVLGALERKRPVHRADRHGAVKRAPGNGEKRAVPYLLPAPAGGGVSPVRRQSGHGDHRGGYLDGHRGKEPCRGGVPAGGAGGRAHFLSEHGRKPFVLPVPANRRKLHRLGHAGGRHLPVHSQQ